MTTETNNEQPNQLPDADDSAGKSTSLGAAFGDSFKIATRWNSFVNRIFGAYAPDSPAFDRFAIKFNAASLTPLVWAAKKMHLMPVAEQTADTAQTPPDARGRSPSPEPRTPA